MRIHLLSDLHLEVQPFRPRHTEAEVVVLAGDIDTGPRAIDWARRREWRDRTVLYVLGNHEFYRGHLSKVALEMKARASATPNVVVLDNDAHIVGNVRFLGCTLWTDFELDGEDNRRRALAAARAAIQDFRSIRYGSTGYLTPEQTVALHRQSLAWLQQELATPFPGKTVVVTHHAPHPGSIHERFRGSPLNAAFVSTLDRFMGRPALWLHGHTHNSFDYEVAGTRVVCNPRGYCRKAYIEPHRYVLDCENKRFIPSLVLEV